jgi:hypothetical protein
VDSVAPADDCTCRDHSSHDAESRSSAAQSSKPNRQERNKKVDEKAREKQSNEKTSVPKASPAVGAAAKQTENSLEGAIGENELQSPTLEPPACAPEDTENRPAAQKTDASQKVVHQAALDVGHIPQKVDDVVEDVAETAANADRAPAASDENLVDAVASDGSCRTIDESSPISEENEARPVQHGNGEVPPKIVEGEESVSKAVESAADDEQSSSQTACNDVTTESFRESTRADEAAVEPTDANQESSATTTSDHVTPGQVSKSPDDEISQPEPSTGKTEVDIPFSEEGALLKAAGKSVEEASEATPTGHDEKGLSMQPIVSCQENQCADIEQQAAEAGSRDDVKAATPSVAGHCPHGGGDHGAVQQANDENRQLYQSSAAATVC